MKHSMAFLLALVLLLPSFCFAIPISAEAQELKDVSLDELVKIVKGAVYFDYFIYVEVLRIPYVPDEEWESTYGNDSETPYRGEFRCWLKDHDFWADHIISERAFNCADGHDNSINSWELPLGVTKESLKKVLEEYYEQSIFKQVRRIMGVRRQYNGRYGIRDRESRKAQ